MEQHATQGDAPEPQTVPEPQLEPALSGAFGAQREAHAIRA